MPFFCFRGEAVVAVKKELAINNGHDAVDGLRLTFSA